MRSPTLVPIHDSLNSRANYGGTSRTGAPAPTEYTSPRRQHEEHLDWNRSNESTARNEESDGELK